MEIKLIIESNFISSKDTEEERVMHKSDNIKFISHNDANEVVYKLSESLRSRYQGNLETLIEGSEFSNSVQLMYDSYHEVSFRRGSS